MRPTDVNHAPAGFRFERGAVLYGILCVLVVTVPIAFDPRGLRPFIPVKAGFLLVGVSLAIAAAGLEGLARAVRDKGRGSGGSSVGLLITRYRVDPWIASAAVFFWLWSVAVAGISAVNQTLHAVGAISLTASMGLTASVILALILPSARTAVKRKECLLTCVAASGLLVAGHTFLQAVGCDPLQILSNGPLLMEGRWRLFSTMGNPNWTAEYMALTVAIAAGVAGRWSTGRFFHFGRCTAVCVWIFFGLLIIAAGSRLAFLAMLVSAGVTGYLRNSKRASSRSRMNGRRLFSVTAIVIASACVPLIWRTVEMGEVDLVARLTDTGSIRGRLVLYAAAGMLLSTSPFTGHGLDHFALLLPDGLRSVFGVMPVLINAAPGELAQRVHLDWLEFGVEAGVVGAVLALTLWGLGMFRLLVEMRSKWLPQRARIGDSPVVELCRDFPGEVSDKDAPGFFTAPLAGVLTAMLVLSLGSAPLHTPSTAAIFWIVLGVAAVCPPQATVRGSGRGSFLPAAIGCVAALAVVVGSVKHASSVFRGNRLAFTGAALAASGRLEEAEDRYRLAFSLVPWDHESGLNLALLQAGSGALHEALATLDAAERFAADRNSWLLRAEVLLRLGRRAEAMAVLGNTVEALPDFLRARMAFGELCVEAGRVKEAAAAFAGILSSPQSSPRSSALKASAARRLALIGATPGESE